MPEIALYNSDTIVIRWSRATHECRVYGSPELCAHCGRVVIRLDPPWGTWEYLCPAEAMLTITPLQLEAARRTLPADAIGLLTSLPVRIEKKER